jgi:NADH-quinone oxidoreductase subunit L
MVLAVLSVAGGWVGIPKSLSFGADLNRFEHFLAPVFEPAMAEEAHAATSLAEGSMAGAEAGSGMGLEYLLMLATLGAVAVGFVLAYRFYRSRPEIPQRLAGRFPTLGNLLANKYYVDELYDAILVQPYWRLCDFLSAFDKKFIDGLVNAVGAFTEVCSQFIKLFQTGQVRRYALWFMLGAIALLWYLV